MKRKSPLLALAMLALLLPSGCKKNDTTDFDISWQVYHLPKYLTDTEIEKAYQETFFEFYERKNDNTVIARNTTRSDVRSITLKLATMADAKIEGTLDPELNKQIEVRVFINFGSYIEEVWSKSYF